MVTVPGWVITTFFVAFEGGLMALKQTAFILERLFVVPHGEQKKVVEHSLQGRNSTIGISRRRGSCWFCYGENWTLAETLITGHIFDILVRFFKSGMAST